MEGIYLASSMVRYRAVVNSELFHNMTVEKTGDFLIRQWLKTDSHIITHVMYRFKQYGLHSRRYLKCLTVKDIQNALLNFQVHDTTILHEISRHNVVILYVIGAQLCVCTQQLAHSVSFQAPHLL
jgi:hypothetical protein